MFLHASTQFSHPRCRGHLASGIVSSGRASFELFMAGQRGRWSERSQAASCLKPPKKRSLEETFHFSRPMTKKPREVVPSTSSDSRRVFCCWRRKRNSWRCSRYVSFAPQTLIPRLHAQNFHIDFSIGNHGTCLV